MLKLCIAWFGDQIFQQEISTVFLMNDDLETVSQIKYIKIMNSEILP